MNQQEIFNTVLFGLRKQGKASTTSQDGGGLWECRYRGPNGLKCAAGMLLKDEYYDHLMEGQPVGNMRIWPAFVESGVPDTDEARSLTRALQGAHDRELANVGLKEWEQRMADIAQDFELGYTWPEAL